MKTHILYLIPAIASMTMAATIRLDGQTVGSPAPDFTLSTDAGTNFTLSSQKGKVIFIFFFGYACPHCLSNGNNTETGIFDVYKAYSEFLAIGVDTWDGNEAGVENFKSQTGLTYPLCYQGSKLEGLYSTTYDRLVVIDQEGIIRYKSTANATSGVVDAASTVIRSLLNITSTEDENTGDDPFLSVHPNPASDRIIVRPAAISDRGATLRIVNTTGQVVAKKEIRQISSDEPVTMSVESLPEGLYFLQYQTEEKTATAKLVIEKSN